MTALKKETTKNKRFSTVKEKLEFIQKNCKEPELFEDLKQLFRKKGFENVEITHGSTEFGKDLVFSTVDSVFGERKWYSVIVKNKNASQNDFVIGGEIIQQIELSSKIAFKDSKGDEHIISGIFVVINGAVSFNAKDILQKFIEPVLLPNIQIWNYQRLGDEIDKHIRDIFLDKVEPAIHVYSEMQIKSLSDMRATNQLFDLKINDIEDIFVNVQTTYSKHLKKVDNYVTFEDEKPTKKNDDDIDGTNEILNSKNNFIIHGIPTSGKSLLLRRLGIKALKEDSLKPNAAFFFEINNFIKGEVVDFEFDKMICQQYSDLTKGEKIDYDQFGRVLLLIDSIDEVQSDVLKSKILSNIDKFVSSNTNKNLQVVLAIRSIDLIDSNEVLSDFERTELLPFNAGQAFKLVKKIIPDNSTKSNAFINALKNSLLSSGLLRTPLALTLMAILYRDDKIDLKELPANITELYNKFTDTYLERWDVSKGISKQYQYEQTKAVLAFIALHMHILGVSLLTEENLKAFLLELRKKFSYEVLNDVEDFIKHLKWNNGIYSYDETTNSFYFYNHYFQEYFVSLCIDDSNEAQLIDNFFSEWWENAIVFYSGKQPRRDIFLLNSTKTVVPINLRDRYIFLELISKCLQASHAISIQSRLIIIGRLVAEFDKFVVEFIAGGKEGKTLAAVAKTIDILINFRELFEKLFASKHISSNECFDYFESLLFEEDNYSEITRYCLAYFIALHRNSPTPLEIFSQSKGLDIIWNRILYVDINFLKFRKKINRDTFVRITRKMNKHRYLILENLKGVGSQVLDGVEKDLEKEEL